MIRAMATTSPNRPTRRRVLAIGAGLVAAPAALSAVTSATSAADAAATTAAEAAKGTTTDPLRLPPLEGGIAALDVALGPRLEATSAGAHQTERLITTTFSMVGVTWRGGLHGAPVVHVRTRKGSGWSGWENLPLQMDLPDDAEGNGRHGTQPVWLGDATGVQVRLVGHRPKDLRLVLMDTGPAEHVSGPETDSSEPGDLRGRLTARPRQWTRAPRPYYFTRDKWGANDAWLNGKPRYCRTLKQVHIHHTATGNDYTKGDVPGIIRGIERYHTQSLGWFDIGYNFLVDKFGRAWVGRAGGPRKLVRGAHTLGFNHVSMGVVVIGNFQIQEPSWASIVMVVKLAAWKIDYYNRNPLGKIWVKSQGSDLFKKGRVVHLPVIDGHRDTNQTACPGNKLYAKLPEIRQLAARRMRRFDKKKK